MLQLFLILSSNLLRVFHICCWLFVLLCAVVILFRGDRSVHSRIFLVVMLLLILISVEL